MYTASKIAREFNITEPQIYNYEYWSVSDPSANEPSHSSPLL